MTEDILNEIADFYASTPGVPNGDDATALIAEVRRLQQALAEARGLIEHWVLKHARSVADNDRLCAALRQYGRHAMDCQHWLAHPCDCGLEEALKGGGEEDMTRFDRALRRINTAGWRGIMLWRNNGEWSGCLVGGREVSLSSDTLLFYHATTTDQLLQILATSAEERSQQQEIQQ